MRYDVFYGTNTKPWIVGASGIRQFTKFREALAFAKANGGTLYALKIEDGRRHIKYRRDYAV